MRTSWLLLVLLLVGAHAGASAQLDARVKVGSRVRVNHPKAQIIGRVMDIHDDTIVVDRGAPDTVMSVPLSELSALAVYGRGKGAHEMAAVFGAIGAATGAGLYISWCAKNPEACRNAEPVDDYPCDDEEPTSLFAIVTTGLGAIGMLIGHALTPPRWHAVDLPVRVGLAPMRSGVAAYVSLPAPRFLHALR